MPDHEREDELEALEQYRKGLQPAPILYRANGIKVDTNPGEPMTFIASEESADRMGDVIEVAGWQLDNFHKNPVFLYMHEPRLLPLGRWAKVWPEKKQLLASPVWDEKDEFAKLVKGKYEDGFMRAVSVGFKPLEFKEAASGSNSLIFQKQELLEISAVAVPAHPKSLRRALSGRSHYWIPFQMDGDTPIAEMRQALVALKDEVDDVLKSLPAQAPIEAVPEWDEVLTELNRMVGI